MLRYFWKLTWRNLTNNIVYAIINLGGLILGMSVSFMLLIYVYHEYSFDKFHSNSDRLYQVYKNQLSNGEIVTKTLSPQPLAGILKNDFPEVENCARINDFKEVFIQYNDKGLKLKSIAADPSLLNMFNFEFIYGSKDVALANSSSIVLTKTAAAALFGDINPIGQVVKFAGNFPLTVSAIINDHPSNSSFTFQTLIPWTGYLAQQPWMKEVGWDNYSFYTYVLLKSEVSVESLNKKIKNLIGQHYSPDSDIKLFLYPFSRQHLYSQFENGVNIGGKIEYTSLFLILAVGILIIACINFMNLSTARSERRARGVGVLKTIGASRLSLIIQFLGESMFMTMVAFVFAILIIIILLPVFVREINIPLSIPYGNLWAWCVALIVAIFTGLLSGSYPALVLSSYRPVKVLKGQIATPKSIINPRKVLVVIQFTFAISLILASAFIYKQISYIKNRSIGYNINGLVQMPVDGKLRKQFESFRLDAIEAGAIVDGALISDPITTIGSSSWDNEWPGQLPGENKLSIDCIAVTYHFINTFGLELIHGRDFASERPGDSTAVILNEAAVKMMRLKEPVGQQIKWLNEKRTIIGVVKNFVWGSPYEPVKPAIIGFVKGWTGSIAVRLNPNISISKSLATLQNIYKQYNPLYPFSYTFTDEAFSAKFENERLLGTMSLIFTVLAIIISCLGLFGLASFSVERRKKEISMRRVLGASVSSLWFKLCEEFIRLVILAFLIGSAISWFAINEWLAKYTYHTSFDIWIFIGTMTLSILICLLAVSWQAIKAALVNPIQSLRSE